MVDLGPEAGSSRFVCPNDRQLALRAKLKTGWSVKTSAFGYKSTPAPLKDDEQNAIVEVIKRAEQLELMEQERVGKLIERLENMRRNVVGRSPSQCLLCGDRFGILGSPRAKCIDCQRFVCQKCAIDANAMKQRSARICKQFPNSTQEASKFLLFSRPNAIKSILRKSKNTIRNKVLCVFIYQKKRKSNSTLVWHSIASKYFFVQAFTFESPNLIFTYSFSQFLRSNRIKSTFVFKISRMFLASRSVSELNWTESRGESKRSSSICSISSSVFKVSDFLAIREDNLDVFQGSEDKKVDTSMGTVELALTYDPVNLTLHCSVYRAKNLIPMDINGLADPFCKLNILPDAKTYTRLRTKTVHKSRNPEFNENLTFYEINEKDLAMKSLHVLVLDDDKYGHDYMGEANIPLANLRVRNTIYLCVPLEMLRPELKGPPPSPDVNQWMDDLWSRGQILLSLCYSTKKRALLVGVVRCTNLLPMDNNGYSDPFVKLHLRPDPYHKKHKTTIKWKNLNPNFNEEFAFETRLTELATQSLCITVWDKDYGKSNDYLGGLVLGGLGSKGQRLKHWLDMIHYPDHRHECWHNLTEDIQLD
ncbi:hypothetical protein FQR65_LT13044 [Abscondita terminalis]|nr:hypothetical protein FQR65_LT13044 [Abscondita terminalis]